MTTGERITRRRFLRRMPLVAASGLLSIGTTIPSSRSALALSHLTWTVTGATIASDDGTLSELILGDSNGADDNVIHVSYRGLNDPPTDIEFEIRLRGTNQGDGEWAGGNDETTWELLTTGSVEVTQHTDETTYSWEEIFGEPTPVDVTDHSEIVLDDFEAPQAATTTEQVLEVEIRARIPEENEVSIAATATATINVTNAIPPDSLNLYYNTSTQSTVRNPAGNTANNNQTVSRWLPRVESIEATSIREVGGSRPRYQTTAIGTPAQPAIEFNGSQRLITRASDGTDLGTDLRRNNTPKQANIFCVFQPRSSTTTGDREVFRLHQNNTNTIHYRRNPGMITVVLQGVQRTIELTTPANTTYLLSLLFRRDGNNVLLEARRNGSQIGSTQNFGDIGLPDQPVVRVGSPNNAAGFNVLFAALRIYSADQGPNVQQIESTMMDAWNIN